MVKHLTLPSIVRAARAARSRVVRAGIAGIAALLGAGCIEVVSLGSGAGDEGGAGPTLTIDPGLLPRLPGLDAIDWHDIECNPSLDTDLDGDGFTPMQGDCDDCDPDVGPDAVEMPTNGGAPADEDCDGAIDEPAPACDSDLAVDAPSPHAAARALDLCVDARRDTWGHERWGLLDAAWVLPDGAPGFSTRAYALGHGILDRFGPNVPVRHGARLLALSSGTARQPTDVHFESPRGFDKRIACEAPEGFPISPSWCTTPPAGEPRDGVALELTVRAPANAEAIAFDFSFYTYEIPAHACTPRDDLFVALLRPWSSSQPPSNIAFDALGSLVSVNTVHLEACACAGGPPCELGGRMHACALGTAPLLGTGFGGDHVQESTPGATGWLTSTAPVARGGTVTLRFSIHDAADGQSDSTVLLDHVRWLRREPVLPRSRRD